MLSLVVDDDDDDDEFLLRFSSIKDGLQSLKQLT